MDAKMSEICEGLLAFVETAIARLEESTAHEQTELQGLSDGLRDAIDTGHLLKTVADHGMDVGVELVDAVERLVRATLKTQPLLLQREIEDLEADASAPAPEHGDWVVSLRHRSMLASMALHRGLEGVYRNAAEMEGER